MEGIKKKNNQELYDEAMVAVRELYNDTSVSVQEAIDNLNCLKDEIDLLVETLETDL